MAKGKKKWRYALGLVALILYIMLTARSIPAETTIRPRWISSLESNFPVTLGDFAITESGAPIPFQVGDRYGYICDDGKFTINQTRRGYISLSGDFWTEYESHPSSVQVMTPQNEMLLEIQDTHGYPLFLDGRIYIIGEEQNAITALGPAGEGLWTHDFPAPVTCIDAAGGYILAGTLDGAIELLSASGASVFPPFEPGGSRLSVILGCAISRDASRLALISGIDEQRFLLLEQSGDSYKVIYHEFLPNKFRRPVHICFADNDGKVVFEREGGLGLYDIGSRSSDSLNLDGRIEVIDNSGGGKYLFVITAQGPRQKRFIVIRYPEGAPAMLSPRRGIPDHILVDAPFKSEYAFFARRDSRFYIGADNSIASFELESK